LCYGCGVCAAFCPESAITIERKNNDIECAVVDETKCSGCGVCKNICPVNGWETIHFPKFISRAGIEECLYPYEDIGICYSRNPQFRRGGSSGGVTTALLDYLLEKKEIEGAIVVKQGDILRGEAYVATTRDEIVRSQKSKYLMVSYEEAVRKIRDYKSLAVVGLPCHLEAIRRAALVFPEIGKIVKFKFSLLCATNNSIDFYYYLMKTRLVDRGDVTKVEFRPGDWWNCTFFSVYCKDGSREDYPLGEGLVPGLIRGRLMVRNACLLCPDFAGYSSDISLGDAWFPAFKGDQDGYNFCVVRNTKGKNLIEALSKEKMISYKTIDIDDFFYSSLLWPLAYKHIGIRGRVGLLKLLKRDVPGNIPRTSGSLSKLNAANIYAGRYLFSRVLQKLPPHRFKKLVLIYCKMVLSIHRLTLILDKPMFYKFLAKARFLGRYPEIKIE
jgi:coenzyme F420 hydrogenase subunit beta